MLMFRKDGKETKCIDDSRNLINTGMKITGRFKEEVHDRLV